MPFPAFSAKIPLMKYPKEKPSNGKNPWLTFIAVVFILTVIWAVSAPKEFFGEPQTVKKASLSEIKTLYTENKLTKIEVKGNELIATLADGTKKSALREGNEGLGEMGFLDTVAHPKTEVEIADTGPTDFIFAILADIIPFIIIVVIIIFLMRQFQKSAGNAFSFGQSKAKLFSGKGKRTTFDDIAGCAEAKNELQEIVEFLKNPKRFLDIGARIPRGVMLVGAPGTGKTLMARAVAGEANVPFFSISGSEFVEMFVGVGASRVRDLFEKAKKNAPAIIFIDEIDAVGRQRGGSGFSGGHDEREQTLNQILSEMDGFEDRANVIVMAATNRPDVLDKALLRPGRFDRRVVIDRPDLKDRVEILNVHAKTKKMDSKIDLEKIAKLTPGFAGADLANILNEAAIQAAKENRKTIAQKDLEFAAEKVIIGPERRSRVITDKEKSITAYHEAGHAIVSHLLPNCDPVHKVTIISRGMSLGSTWNLPQEDRFTVSKSKFIDELSSLLGGYAAEILIFDEPTTGAASDLQRATEIARRMVTRYGMSPLGPIAFDEDLGGFTGIDLAKGRTTSEETAKKIDTAVADFVQNALKKTQKILQNNKDKLETITKALLKKETLNEKEFQAFFN